MQAVLFHSSVIMRLMLSSMSFRVTCWYICIREKYIRIFAYMYKKRHRVLRGQHWQWHQEFRFAMTPIVLSLATIRDDKHWVGNAMLTRFSSLVALKFNIWTTTSGAANDENFQRSCHHHVQLSCHHGHSLFSVAPPHHHSTPSPPHPHPHPRHPETKMSLFWRKSLAVTSGATSDENLVIITKFPFQ